MKRWLFALALLAGGCTHSVHQSAVGGLDDIPRGQNVRFIEAESDQRVFLVSGNTNFADHAMDALLAQCPNGHIVGVEARHSTSLGFFVFTNRLKTSGYCVED